MRTWTRRAIAILGYAFWLGLTGFAAPYEIPFTATAVANWVNFGTALDDGTHLLILNARARTVLRASDARVSGGGFVTCSGVWQTNKLGVTWGSFHLSNAGGTWDGYWQGTNSFENGHVVMSLLLAAEGSARYQGLVLRSTSTSVDNGLIQCTGCIIPDGNRARPYEVKGFRIDRAIRIKGMLLDPLTLRPTGTQGTLEWIVIGSQREEASYLGHSTEEGLGLSDPITGVCSVMGATAPDSGQGDVLRWVAQAITDHRTLVSTNLRTAVVTAEVHFAGGTGRFQGATGGFSGRVAQLISPTPTSTVFQNSFQYQAAGTIRFDDPAEAGK